LLERAEQTVRIADTPARILHPDSDAVFLGPRPNAQLTYRLILHGALAVLDEIQEDLDQALAIGPNRRKPRLDFPLHLEAVLAQRGFHDDADFFEQRREIQPRRRVAGLAKLHAGDLFQSDNQGA
jgi:hypothetical protein